jgi:hypothetical protein
MIASVMPVLAADAGMELESALHREIVMGDLKGAIAAYRAIEADPAAPRAVLAKAWLHMGLCYERSGDGKAAAEAYTEIVKNFGAGPEAATAGAGLARLRPSRAEPSSGPRNLRFETGAARRLRDGLCRNCRRWPIIGPRFALPVAGNRGNARCC